MATPYQQPSLHLPQRIRLTPLQPGGIDLQRYGQLNQDPGALGLPVFDLLNDSLLGLHSALLNDDFFEFIIHIFHVVTGYFRNFSKNPCTQRRIVAVPRTRSGR